MDSAEAREILKLYRPDSTDAADPQTAEALSLVDRDPELDHWFREHCEVYTAIRAKLKQIPVPADLKRKILVERPSAQSMGAGTGGGGAPDAGGSRGLFPDAGSSEYFCGVPRPDGPRGATHVQHDDDQHQPG
jgi:hypothetical protein